MISNTSGAMEDECEEQSDENENIPDTPVNDHRNCNDNRKEIKEDKDATVDKMSPKSPKLSIHSFDDDRKSQFDSSDKENYQYVNVNITPGAMILTPKAKSVGPTPDRSPGSRRYHFCSPMLSPVSRNKKPREVVGPPIESSTPTK